MSLLYLVLLVIVFLVSLKCDEAFRYQSRVEIHTSKRAITDSQTDVIAASANVTTEKKKVVGTPVRWCAASKGSVKVKELKRSVEEYMALPASQYSVLAADQIVRLSDDKFKCVLPTMNFFGNKITPVLFVDVNVYPAEARSEIIVSRAETTGSDIAELINGTFSILAVNKVSANVDKKGSKILTSETSLELDVIVPKSVIPTQIIRSSGNVIFQNTLNIVVPVFLRILGADFRRWSAGDDSRAAVEGATLTFED